MKNVIEEFFKQIEAENKLKTFDVESIKNLPDLAKGYLFQVEFKDVDYNPGKIYDDLMLKVRKVDFHEDDDGFDIIFDEFQDFKVWQQLQIFVRSKVYLDITFKFYDSKLQKVLHTYTKKNCVCKKVFPLNLDVSSNKKLEIKASFNG